MSKSTVRRVAFWMIGVGLVMALMGLTIMTCLPAEAAEPEDDLNSLLPNTNATWKRALVRWDSLTWFATSCEDETLPVLPSYRLSMVVEERGRISRAAGFMFIIGWWPSQEYELADDFAHVVLGHDHLMTFGLYCITVSEGVEARITCWEHWTSCGVGTTTRELTLGNNLVLVHPEKGMARGLYRVEMKCDDCFRGVLTSVRFRPLRPYWFGWR